MSTGSSIGLTMPLGGYGIGVVRGMAPSEKHGSVLVLESVTVLVMPGSAPGGPTGGLAVCSSTKWA